MSRYGKRFQCESNHVDDSFRHFVATCGFVLPGEAQRLDRILGSFSRCYFEDNAGDTINCPFKDEDAVYLLVFAMVMLNTDLHKRSSAGGRRPKKMTKPEFLNNLRLAMQHEVFPRDYVCRTYESVASKPIQLLAARSSEDFNEGRNMLENVNHVDSILRGVAVHDYNYTSFASMKEHSHVARSCARKIWHSLHGVVNTSLEYAHLDPEGLASALDTLLYGLVITVGLDMSIERSAFLAQFVRLCLFGEQMRGLQGSDMAMRAQQLKWFEELDKLCGGPVESKLEVLRRIKAWVMKLKTTLRIDSRNKSEMHNAVAELINADFLLNDPARTFLQSGILVKKSNRTGRPIEYKFFLFSDLLLYASKQEDGNFKIHEEMPLHLMKVVDWFPAEQRGRELMFQIHHPRKTFTVVCPTKESRRSWVQDIRAAVMVEMERKMTVEAARASTR